MKNELLSQVYKHPLINPEELEKIMAAHRKVLLKKGEFVLQEGETSHSYMILEKGLIRSYVIDYKGNDITTDFFCEGDLVIEVLSLFQRTPT